MQLSELPDQSFKATHPASLQPAIINRVLRGLQVQEQPRLLQALLAGTPQTVPAFSGDEADFLAPLITSALSKATPQQQVVFQVLHSGPSHDEVTGGTLYNSGRLLYVSLTHYRHSPSNAHIDSKPGRHLPDPAELDSRQVLFIPETAQSSGGERKSRRIVGGMGHATLAIDYGLLSQLPAPQAEMESSVKEAPAVNPARPADPSTPTLAKPLSEDSSKLEELRALKEYAIKKDMENEGLKEELNALRRQLADQEAELNKVKKRKSKKEKSLSSP
ncbi:MAG: hypothetical protein KGO52_13965 [Nitrospirota bacterium]|nr:hypothetical protein [Nitrospirota bacterium]